MGVSIRLAVGGRGRRGPRLAYEVATLNANRNRVGASGRRLGRWRGVYDGIRHRAAEPPVPCGVYLARVPQVAAVEVGPERVEEHQFRVGGLPEQEVRQALLAGRPDEQIHIRNTGFVQVAGEKAFVDLVRTDFP